MANIIVSLVDYVQRNCKANGLEKIAVNVRTSAGIPASFILDSAKKEWSRNIQELARGLSSQRIAEINQAKMWTYDLFAASQGTRTQEISNEQAMDKVGDAVTAGVVDLSDMEALMVALEASIQEKKMADSVPSIPSPEEK